MSWLFAMAQPFVWHPERAGLVAGAWAVLALSLPRAVRRPIVVAAVAWGVFALLELEAWRERADIRVDLLFTWPALLVITATCTALGARRLVSYRTRC